MCTAVLDLVAQAATVLPPAPLLMFQRGAIECTPLYPWYAAAVYCSTTYIHTTCMW
jgi:hypothetical protein